MSFTYSMLPIIPLWASVDFRVHTRTVFTQIPITRTLLAQTTPSLNHEDTATVTSSHDKASCKPCLYTGIATCAGFAGYFYYLATEPQNVKHKKFLLASSCAWTVAGMYRYYLG